MSIRKLKYGIYVAIAGLGMLAGFFIRNYPYIQWKREVTIAEIANFFVTLGIGAFIPYVIAKGIDSKRSQKAEVIDDCKLLLAITNRVKVKIDACFNSGSITSTDKAIISAAFEESQDKVYNLHAYLEILFPNNNLPHSRISIAYDDYWRCITAGSLMGSQYHSIDATLHTEHLAAWSVFEQSIKLTILQIHGL